jgi:hypothetical protein
MPIYHNDSAHIHGDGQALAKYQVEYDDYHKLVSCWILSQAGKVYPVSSSSFDSSLTIGGIDQEFSVHIRNTTSNGHVKFTMKMDSDCTNK